MSSHFSRIIYDKKCSDERYGESIAPGNYNLFDGQANNSKTCHPSNGPRPNSNSRSNVYGCSLEGRTAFESELRNITEPFQRNKDITLNQKNQRTDILKQNNTCVLSQECPSCYEGQDCKCDFQQTNYSRLNNTIDNLRELSTQYLMVDSDVNLDSHTDWILGFNQNEMSNLCGKEYPKGCYSGTKL